MICSEIKKLAKKKIFFVFTLALLFGILTGSRRIEQ